jgi:hypothetical protein
MRTRPAANAAMASISTIESQKNNCAPSNTINHGGFSMLALFHAAAAFAAVALVPTVSAQHANTITELPISFDANIPSAWSSDYTCKPYRCAHSPCRPLSLFLRASSHAHNVSPALICSWDDYSVNISASHIDENIMFEVVDLHTGTEGYRTDAMSLHLFPQAIPSDRVARQKAMAAINLVYSVTVDSCVPSSSALLVVSMCERALTAPLAQAPLACLGLLCQRAVRPSRHHVQDPHARYPRGAG